MYHETSVCSQRPYSCEYCRDFKSTFEDVTSNHLSVCPDRPVPCSNGCGSTSLLKLLQDHLKECPFEVIECAFSYAGCSEKLPRKDMPEHITQSLAIHMSLQATSHRQEVVKLNQRISELATEVAEWRIANQNLVAEVSTLRRDIKKAQAETKQEITKEVLFDMAALHSHVGLVPFNVTMTGFQQKKRSNSEWYSPPFYTHPRGYKMCLEVDANGNGCGKGSHVSVFVFMMKGEYDDSLKWPFLGDITVQLLNQIENDARHHVDTVCVTAGHSLSKRVLEGERSGGTGFPTFIPHRDLTPRYLKDDRLMFCIKK